MIEVYVYKVETEYIERHLDTLMEQLCSWRYEKASKIGNGKAKVVSVAAGLLIQNLLLKKYGLKKDDIEVSLGEQGKPVICYLPDNSGSRRIHFNISHSGNYVAAAISDNNIGIDIECKEDKGLRVARRCFAESEYQYILAQPEAVRMRTFRDIWAMKESCLKYTGTGISVPLSSVLVDMHENKAVTEQGDTVWYDITHLGSEAGEGEYSLAVCSAQKEIRKTIQYYYDISILS